MKYKTILINVIEEQIKNIELISETSNKVYKIELETGRILYAKFYEENSYHVDNELMLYDLIDNKYLKEIYYKSEVPKFAIYKELKGKTIDMLDKYEKDIQADNIVSNVIEFFNEVSKNKVTGYGKIDSSLKGKYKDFYDFLEERQNNTSDVLNEYPQFSNLYYQIMKKYKKIIKPDNSLIPIDTNLKNIMLLEDNKVKFIDPGEMISGPILMAYGDFVAHIYKTSLYDKLIEMLNLNTEEIKLLRIYAIFSSLNILAFLKKNGVDNLEAVIPYGNTYTFYELIKEHLKFLNLD